MNTQGTEKKANICKHCGNEYNFMLPAGYCTGCLNYLHHDKGYKSDFERIVEMRNNAIDENLRNTTFQKSMSATEERQGDDWEKTIIENGYHDHSIQTFCWNCNQHGVNFPYDNICGNCNSTDTTTYYPKESITKLLSHQEKELRERVISIVTEMPFTQVTKMNAGAAQKKAQRLPYL